MVARPGSLKSRVTASYLSTIPAMPISEPKSLPRIIVAVIAAPPDEKVTMKMQGEIYGDLADLCCEVPAASSNAPEPGGCVLISF